MSKLDYTNWYRKPKGFFFVQTRQNSGSIKTQGFGITQGIFTKTQGRFYQNSDFGIFNNFAKYCLYFIYYKRRAKIVNIDSYVERVPAQFLLRSDKLSAPLTFEYFFLLNGEVP